MKTYSIKITGSGTRDQLAIKLLEIGRELQVIGVYGDESEVERETEDDILMIEIEEE